MGKLGRVPDAGNEAQRRESARTDVIVLVFPLTHCMCVGTRVYVWRHEYVSWVCVSARVCAPTYVSLREPAAPVCPCAGGCAHVYALCGGVVCAAVVREDAEGFLQCPGREQSGKFLLLFSLHRTNFFPPSWAQIHL